MFPLLGFSAGRHSRMLPCAPWRPWIFGSAARACWLLVRS